MAFYATANLQNRYKQDYVTTASPVELIIMLYEGCIKQLKLAKIHREYKEFDKISGCFDKAAEIILELVRSLDFSVPMADELLKLYQFMVDEITHASLLNDTERIEPVIQMLTSLCEAWGEVRTRAESSTYTQE